MNRSPQKRRICFVTGSRAEFGLMESTLRAIQKHPKLELQIVATGMHLDSQHGRPLSAIWAAGFRADVIVAWSASSKSSPNATAKCTGQAIAEMAQAFRKLRPEIILVVGDRVEAFAAASASHVGQIPIAHIHGGDRALGQIDDSVRHSITKLSHIHFPATKQSAARIGKLGEQSFRIHRVGSPALDGIKAMAEAILKAATCRFALIVLHPVSSDAQLEERLARDILSAAENTFGKTVAIYPNNDPGSAGIIRALEASSKLLTFPDLTRDHFLWLLGNAAVLIGNSSSGIIEAASFGTPVINIGDRQKGRERNANVVDTPANASAIRRALKKVWNNGRPIRFPKKNIYGSGRTSEKIANILASVPLDDRLRRKLISY